MSLTDNEKLLIWFNDRCYFYLAPLPVNWNKDYTALVNSKIRFHWLFYFGYLTFLWLYSLTFAYAGLYELLYGENKAHGTLLCLRAAGLAAVPTFVLGTFGNFSKGVNLSVANNALELLNAFLEEFPHLLEENAQAVSQWIYALEILALTFFPFGILFSVFGILFLDIDTFGKVLEKYVLPDAMYRDTYVILWSFLLRFGVGWMVVAESFRIASTIAVSALPFIDRFHTMIAAFETTRIFPKFATYYNWILIFYAGIKSAVFRGAYILISYGFWMAVVLAWMCITCSVDQVSLPMYIWYLSACMLLLAVQAFLIPLACKAIESGANILSMYQFRSRFLLAKKRNSETRYEMRKLKALQTFKFTYGFFGDLNNDFVMEYFWAFAERTVDAVLTFQ